jgi:hypothetical protein
MRRSYTFVFCASKVAKDGSVELSIGPDGISGPSGTLIRV